VRTAKLTIILAVRPASLLCHGCFFVNIREDYG
jgi:hypothetical protein